MGLGISEWVKTVAYCENEHHAQSVLLSRMADGLIEIAPIWDNIETLTKEAINVPIDIIFGGFPCQDLSAAGTGAGLDGKRSGLFFQIVRLAKELKPTFIYLENVPAIRTRGLRRVVRELAAAGYVCRWDSVSAAEVGANHKRQRWFLVAYSNSSRKLQQARSIREIGHGACLSSEVVAHPQRSGLERLRPSAGKQKIAQSGNGCSHVPNTKGKQGKLSRLYGRKFTQFQKNKENIFHPDWWATEPNVGRVASGVAFRVDRIKRLGNCNPPLQYREAFKKLIGLKDREF